MSEHILIFPVCGWLQVSHLPAVFFFFVELLFLINLRVWLQVELTGSSVFDYIHPADHVEMAERLGIRPHLRAEAGCHVAPESASSSASTSSLSGTPEPGLDSNITHTPCSRIIQIRSSLRIQKQEKQRKIDGIYNQFSFTAAPASPHSIADDPPDRGFFIRMKSTLTKRGLHVKSSGYKVHNR